MIRGPENLIVKVSGKRVVMRALPPWFSVVKDDAGMLWFRDMAGEWWGQ